MDMVVHDDVGIEMVLRSARMQQGFHDHGSFFEPQVWLRSI